MEEKIYGHTGGTYTRCGTVAVQTAQHFRLRSHEGADGDARERLVVVAAHERRLLGQLHVAVQRPADLLSRPSQDVA